MKRDIDQDLRTRVREGLDLVGLLGTVRALRRWGQKLYRYAASPADRRALLEHRRRFVQFKRKYRDVLRPGPRGPVREMRRVLFICRRFPSIEIELALIKSMQSRNVEVTIVLPRSYPHLRAYYRLAGVREFLSWVPGDRSHEFREQAEAMFAASPGIESLKALSHGNVRVGMAALLTAMRRLRSGRLDLGLPSVRELVLSRLAQSLAAANCAPDLLARCRPDLVLTADIEYTPSAELFDTCLTRGIPVVKLSEGHRDSTLTFWRYSMANRDEHFWSLSAGSWNALRALDWTEERRSALREEFRRCYATGDWYTVPGTQRGTRLVQENEVRAALDLEAGKPTAVIFTHIPWDCSFRWGKDLFDGYEEWLIETVRAASQNDRVQWRIKAHPAHLGKDRKEGFSGEPAEIAALRQALGKLPPHVRVIPADTPISTWSLLAVTDYCLTVRGTIGIEAAARGIPVLTAGTGRYDGKGFTIDSCSRDDYLQKLARIEDISPISEAASGLAQKFAYGLFLCRPVELSSASYSVERTGQIERDDTGLRAINLLESSINLRDVRDWDHAADLSAFADWLVQSDHADLLSIPAVQGPAMQRAYH